MKYLFLEYPKCSTCQKAKKWLEENGISYDDRHIVEQNPTVQELKEWVAKSGQPLRKFFNTSGMLYRSMELKDKLPSMSEEEQFALLATNAHWRGCRTHRIPATAMGDGEKLSGFGYWLWRR